MNRRSLLLNNLLTPVLVLCVVGLALALSTRHFMRLDLTSDGDFSLEPVTTELLAGLPEPLIIRAYFTADMEPPYHKVEGVVRDLLDEYRARNPGQITIEWIDPTDDPDMEAEAQRLGVEPATLKVEQEGRREAHRVWMGVVLLYRDRVETLESVRTLDDLEYQLTRRIRFLAEDRELPVVGFTTGHDELDLMEGGEALAPIRAAISETYTPRAVTLDAGSLEEVDVLVVLGARTPLREDERLAIDQFLMSGRPAAFFRTSLRPDPGQRKIHRCSDNLGELLGHYGIQMGTYVVADRFTNGLMPVPVRRGNKTGTGYVNHALVPLVTDLDRRQVITRGVDTLELPLASPLTLAEQPAGCPECTFHELAFSGHNAVALPEATSLVAEDYLKPQAGELPGPFLLVAGLEGSLRSYRAEEAANSAELAERSPEGTRLLVVASSDYTFKNLGFFLNSLDWLVLDADLLALRPDRSLPPVLEPLGKTQGHLLRLANLAALPLLLAVVSVWRAQRRRRSR